MSLPATPVLTVTLSPNGENPLLNHKPKCSYNCLIGMALLASKTGRLPVNAIYQFLQNAFPYFRNSAPRGWKNSVRHSLSLSSFFQKVPGQQDVSQKGWQSKKGHKWEIAQTKRQPLEKEIQRFLNDQLALQHVRNAQQELCGTFQLDSGNGGPSYLVTATQTLSNSQLEMILRQHQQQQPVAAAQVLHLTTTAPPLQTKTPQDQANKPPPSSSSHTNPPPSPSSPSMERLQDDPCDETQGGVVVQSQGKESEAEEGECPMETDETVGGDKDLSVLLESVNMAIEQEYGCRQTEKDELSLDEVIAAVNAVEGRGDHPVYINTSLWQRGVCGKLLFSPAEERVLLRELKYEARLLNMGLCSYVHAAVKNVF